MFPRQSKENSPTILTQRKRNVTEAFSTFLSDEISLFYMIKFAKIISCGNQNRFSKPRKLGKGEHKRFSGQQETDISRKSLYMKKGSFLNWQSWTCLQWREAVLNIELATTLWVVKTKSYMNVGKLIIKSDLCSKTKISTRLANHLKVFIIHVYIYICATH